MQAIRVYEHTRKTKEGKPFKAYSTTLEKKTGEKVYADVKFRQECGLPSHFPCSILVIVGNVKPRPVGDKTYYTLWVKAFNEVQEEGDLDEFV